MNKNAETALVQRCRRKRGDVWTLVKLWVNRVHLFFSVVAIPIKQPEAVLSMNGMVKQRQQNLLYVHIVILL